MTHKAKQNPRRRVLRNLFIIIVGILGVTMFNLSQAPSQLRTLHLTIPQAQVEHELEWLALSDADERFVDSAFSVDGTQVYTLTPQHLRVYALAEGQLILQDTLTLDEALSAGSLAVHPNGQQIAIGAVEKVDYPPTTRGILLTVDVPSLTVVDQLSSNASYNLGRSLAIAYTPDGDYLHHLFNLNNAGCGRTFDRLERWHLASVDFELIQLPYSHIADMVVTDNFIAATVHASCIPMPGSDTQLVIRSEQGEDQTFTTPGTVGYQNLLVSHDQQVMVANVDTIQPPFASTIHIWEAQDLSEALETDQIVQSMAISPDNRTIALAIVRDMPATIDLPNPDVELHLYDRVSRRITHSHQISLQAHIQQIHYSPDGNTILLRTQHHLTALPLN